MKFKNIMVYRVALSLFCAFFMTLGGVFFAVGTAMAASDSPSPLVDTPDILAANGDFGYRKVNMLAIVAPGHGDATGQAQAYLFDNSGNKNGTLRDYNFGDFHVTSEPFQLSNSNIAATYRHGRSVALTVKPDSNGDYRFFVPMYLVDARYFTIGKVKKDNNGNMNIDDVKRITLATGSNASFATDATAGLFIDGEETESFVVGEAAYYDGDVGDYISYYGSTSPVNLGFRVIPGEAYNADSYRWSSDNYTSVAKGQNLDLGIVRVAAGDFDGDGICSEVAVIANSCVKPNVNGREDADSEYIVQVYKISRKPGSSLVDARQIYSNSKAGTHRASNLVGCDIAAGDFDGDGKTEFAVVMSHYDRKAFSGHTSNLNHADHFAHPKVQVYKWNGGAMKMSETILWDDAHVIGECGYVGFFDSNHRYGVLAEAGDFDGDGQDELVWAAFKQPTDNPVLPKVSPIIASAFTFDKTNLAPKEVNYVTPPIGPSNSNDFTSQYIYPHLSMLIAPLRGQLNPVTGKTLSQLVLSDRSRYCVYEANIDEKGVFKGINPGYSGLVSIGNGKSSNINVPLLAADFLDEGYALGDPDWYVMSGHKDLSAVVQVPPYHVDYVPVADDPTSKLRNFSFVRDNSASYTVTNTGSTTDTFTARASASTAKGGGLNAGAAFPFSIVKGNLGASMQNSVEQSLEKLNTNKFGDLNRIAINTGMRDAYSYMEGNYYLWRYPMPVGESDNLAPGAPGDPDNPNSTNPADSTQYLEIVVPDKISNNLAKGDDDDYAPIHQEGNIFSYPVSVTGTLGYPKNNLTSSGQPMVVPMASDGGYSSYYKQIVYSSKSDTASITGTQEKSDNLSLGLTIPIPKAKGANFGAGGNLSYTNKHTSKNMYTMSTTVETDKELSYKVSGWKGMSFPWIRVQYSSDTIVFAEDNGTLNLAFGVRFDNASAGNVWTDQNSIYMRKPDPALNLPRLLVNKYSPAQEERVIFQVENIAENAMRMRGARIYNPDGDLTWKLNMGETYRITIPVYNYSFIATGQFSAQLSYAASFGGERTAIGQPVPVSLPGRSNDANNPNYATVSFNWTVPASFKNGERVYIFAELDGGGAIDEIHEAWDYVGDIDCNGAGDPMGNNVGYFEASIAVTPQTFQSTGAKAATFGKIQAAAKDFELRLTNMTAKELTDALNARESVFVRGSVLYKGTETITDAHLRVFEGDYNHDGGNSQIVNRRILSIIPGEEREFFFRVNGAELVNKRVTLVLTGNEIAEPITASYPSGPAHNAGPAHNGGGCDAGLGLTGMLALFALAAKMRKTR
ncbi:hypothetical protein FACS1894216_18270 [Synergistales bacterium]|nr:hypothetical protein FACS1894216_18270 [Synergistales bacterium]